MISGNQLRQSEAEAKRFGDILFLCNEEMVWRVTIRPFTRICKWLNLHFTLRAVFYRLSAELEWGKTMDP
jgi:hypothetical protein